jgi:hypothetical protein
VAESLPSVARFDIIDFSKGQRLAGIVTDQSSSFTPQKLCNHRFPSPHAANFWVARSPEQQVWPPSRPGANPSVPTAMFALP